LPEPTPEDAPPPPPEKAAVVAPKDVPLPHIRPNRPAKPKPVPEESTSDLDQIQALLDKRKLEQMAAAEPTEATEPTVGIQNGTPTAKMTANELEALRARLAQCWSPPLGWTDPSEVRVVLMLNLNQDGTVNGAPEVVESPQGQYSTTAPESAVRAVRRCAPYNLPADKYDAWRQVRVTFDPRDMGGA
jgi:colicin import membrane protein